MEPFVCLHGHFYQPPRENPWLEEVELQDSAYPYHDWNDRITAECYEPNTAARILDREEHIVRIVSNYARMSFNFGPTLLSWMERHRPAVYDALREADRQSRENFSGHGAALAQTYSHLIMPLANARDKRTQVHWGVADFRHRFGRAPEGMWLPETAVDLETLEALAEAGIAFTILAPHQAGQVRRLGEEAWQPVAGASIDPKMPYKCLLPSGRGIALFFYDGPISQEIAFSELLADGEKFARRLLGTRTEKKQPQLIHVATDGETYGHHHRFGEMALAYCLDFIEREKLARITVYGEHLAAHPPTHEVQILENTSWSCAHGVERWRSDCGCSTGGQGGWHQRWRAPLRAALDWLRDALIPLYEAQGAELFRDPWAARDAYIAVVLDRSPRQVQDFLAAQAGRRLAAAEAVKALRLLEMQRHAMLMYTSCGWFFAEVSGIETTQILAYAGRALQLAAEVAGADLLSPFLERLKKVPSNLPRWGNAGRLFREKVLPVRLDLPRVAAHHVIVSEFENGEATDGRRTIYCYRAEDSECRQSPGGRMKLVVGRTRIRSEITWNSGDFSFALLHFGGQSLSAGIRPYRTSGEFAALQDELHAIFARGDIPEVVRRMDRHFAGSTYSIWHLFRDEQRRVLQQIMAQTMAEVEDAYQAIYENHFSLIHFLREIDMPIPRPLAMPVEMVLTDKVRELLEAEQLHPAELQSLTEEVENLALPLDEPMLGLAAGRQLARQMERLARSPQNLALLLTILEALKSLCALPFKPDLWQAQNLYWQIYRWSLADKKERPSGEWQENFRELGRFLGVDIG